MNWHAAVALTLAVGLTSALIILSIADFFHDGHMTEAEATTVATVLGAVVGAVATYLGTKEDKS